MITINKKNDTWELFRRSELGKNVCEIVETDDCKILRVDDESGEGAMTMYSVFDGVYMMFNDFHMKRCYSGFSCEESVLCIDHCREGRIEHRTDRDMLYYMEAGDMRIDKRVHHTGNMNFPLCHYHGLTIGFQLERAEKALQSALPAITIDLKQIAERFGSGEKPFVMRKNEVIERIFADLYNVPSEIRTDYFRIKTAELLIQLGAMKMAEQKEEKPYFYSRQIEKIKAMYELMVSDLTKSYTLDELSERFDMSLSTLKSCFKGVYGSPVYSYMREYKMNYAAALLVQDNHIKINEIAALVGYDNPSKFSAAFRDTMGVSPIEYRKRLRSEFVE